MRAASSVAWRADCRWSTCPAAAEHLFGIIQEAVANALSHAAARRIEIDLSSGESPLVAEVRDDGSGFDRSQAEARGAGLATMRNRAARIGALLVIGPRPGGGTIVSVTLPRPLVLGPRAAE